MSLCEIIVLGLSSQLNKTAIFISPKITIMVWAAILSKFLYFISLKTIIALMHGSTNENEHTNRATALLNVVPFVSLYIIFLLITVLLNTHMSIHFRHMLSSCAILLLSINVLIFYIYHYTQQKNKDFTELQIQLQKEYDMVEYYKTLFNQNENQQILIHDIRKHLMAISQLNKQNNTKKINSYLDTLLNSSDLQNSVHVSDNELLNSILCHYIKICQERNITFRIDVRKKLLHNFDYSELTALFCNLLDNAIEACSNIPDAYIELNMSNKKILISTSSIS